MCLYISICPGSGPFPMSFEKKENSQSRKSNSKENPREREKKSGNENGSKEKLIFSSSSSSIDWYTGMVCVCMPNTDIRWGLLYNIFCFPFYCIIGLFSRMRRILNWQKLYKNMYVTKMMKKNLLYIVDLTIFAFPGPGTLVRNAFEKGKRRRKKTIIKARA